MVKRKFLMSVIITLVAAITLVSGTYAWFLVGGFGSLFDIGFNVMDAGAGLELKGSATDAQWKSGEELVREDFTDDSFVDKGYFPVSSATGITDSFKKVVLDQQSNAFMRKSDGQKGVDYNDFYLFIRSTKKADGTRDAQDVGITIEMTGDAANAGRVSIQKDGDSNATIYALTGNEGTYAVTKDFDNGTIEDTNNNRIIDLSEDSNNYAGLEKPELKLNNATVPLEGIGGDENGTRVNIRVWIEGNDSDCVDFKENTIVGKDFHVKIGFTALG